MSKIQHSLTFKGYRLGTEFGAEYVAYGCDQQRVELLAQAEEMTEGQDNHLFGMTIQPLSYLHENALAGEHKPLLIKEKQKSFTWVR